jgi:hypothetical protein
MQEEKVSEGLYFHHWVKGRIEHQGQMLTSYTAQLFEWFLGHDSDVIEVNDQYWDDCTFYPTAEDMRIAYVGI